MSGKYTLTFRKINKFGYKYRRKGYNLAFFETEIILLAMGDAGLRKIH